MIYFRGCVARDKEKSIAEATEIILKKARIDYNIIDNEECCGSVLLRTGFEEEGIEQMLKNLRKLTNNTDGSSLFECQNSECQKIIVSCAGCYKTLKKDYKEHLGVELDVIHISQLLEELVREKKIKFKKIDHTITYHDPCHLGRHCGEYESPRDVLRKISKLVEMDHNRENAKCCGAGGGVKSAYPEIADNIALQRINEAEKTDCDILTTSCPFCLLNLKQNHAKTDLEIIDLTELIVRCLEDE